MELLVLASLGAILGWAVSLFVSREEDNLVWRLVAIGAVGALMAGTIVPLLMDSNATPSGGTDAPNVLLALAGAATLLGLYQLIRRLGRSDH